MQALSSKAKSQHFLFISIQMGLQVLKYSCKSHWGRLWHPSKHAYESIIINEMSLQKFRKSVSSHSDSLQNVQTAKIDCTLTADYEYLLQKSAEELSRVKEMNQQLINQLQQTQFVDQEKLQSEICELRSALERKKKAASKMKQKFRQFEQLQQENQNLKRDLEDLIKEKIQSRREKGTESIKSQSETQRSKEQSDFDKENIPQNRGCAGERKYKILDEADIFLQQNKILTAASLNTFKPSPPQVIQLLQLNPMTIDIEAAQKSESELLKHIQALYQEGVSQVAKQAKLLDSLAKLQENVSQHETYIQELQDEVWVWKQKYKMQADIVQLLMHSPIQNQIAKQNEMLRQLFSIIGSFHNSSEGCQCLQILEESALQGHLAELNRCLARDMENQKTLKRQACECAQHRVLVQELANEFETIKQEQFDLFSSFDELRRELELESQAEDVERRCYQKVLEIFENPDACIMQPQLRQIQSNIDRLVAGLEKQQQNQRQSLVTIANNLVQHQPKLADEEPGEGSALVGTEMRFLDLNKLTTQVISISSSMGEVLRQRNSQVSTSKEIINLQMKIIQNLMLCVQSNPAVLKSNCTLQLALQDLKTLNAKLQKQG